MARRPVEYDTGFTLFPGRYSIKFLARDDETGRIGTYQTSFRIPDLNKVMKTIPISSVVLSGQRVNQCDALYNVTHGKTKRRNMAANPLVDNDRKLIPSVTRVFSRKGQLFVYWQAYAGAESDASESRSRPPILAFVSLNHDQKNVFETEAKAVQPISGGRLGTVPFSFDIPLARVAPGRYECQISVLDPVHHRASFWIAPLLVRR